MRKISSVFMLLAGVSAGCGDSGGASSIAPGADVSTDVGGSGGGDVAEDVGEEDAADTGGVTDVATDAGLDAGDPDAALDAGPEDAADVGGSSDVAADALLDVVEDTLSDVADSASEPDVAPDVALDAGEDTQPTSDVVEPPTCDLGDPGDDDRPRIVLIGHPFTSTIGVKGTEIRSMSLAAGALPVDDGMKLDVGVRPARIAFVPSGEYALVLGEDGDLVSVAVGSATDLEIVDSVKLPSAGYGDIAVSEQGDVAWVVGSNVNETSGVSVVHIACDGTLTVDAAGFLNIRLTESIAVLPGEQSAVLLGGQAVFDPKDPNDIRMLGRVGDAWEEVAAFDVFQDFVNTGRIAASPDGTRVLVPNASVFSEEEGDVSVLGIGDETLSEDDRITTLSAVSEALFAPDGLTALVSRPEVNRVAILTDTGAGLEVTGEVKGLGLADQMALIARGSSEGLVLIPSVDVDGAANVAALLIEGPGLVSDLGQVELGGGSDEIPDAIAVMP